MEVEARIRRNALSDAAEHLRAALELLDRAGAPAQIGAYVDLAACELEMELAAESPSRPRLQRVH